MKERANRDLHEMVLPGGAQRLKGISSPALLLGLVGALMVAVMGCGKPSSPASKPPSGKNSTSEAEILAWPESPGSERVKFLMVLSTPDDMKFKKSWSQKAFEWIAGSERNRFIRPYDVTVKKDIALVVADPGSRSVHVFDLKREQYRNITLEGRVGFSSPVGVALDDNGHLFVTDSENGVVFVLDLEGKLLRTLGTKGELGRPTGLAFNPRNGLLYVADTEGHRVIVMDDEGQKKFEFGSRGEKPGEFNYPTHIFISSGGEVYVTDSMNFRIQAFGPEGTFRFTLGQAGDGAGDFSKPKGVAVDSAGHIYVVDAMFDTVQILDRNGVPLLAFGSPGQASGEFWLPSGLWIDERDRIYVADSFNNRVQVFQYVKR